VVHTFHPKLCRRLRLGGFPFQANTGKKKVCETPSQWKKLGVVVHVCHPTYGSNVKTKVQIGRSWSRTSRAKSENLLQNNQNKTGGLAQAIQHLPSKCEALSSKHSTTKKEMARITTYLSIITLLIASILQSKDTDWWTGLENKIQPFVATRNTSH
jgi:hypothetical protein